MKTLTYDFLNLIIVKQIYIILFIGSKMLKKQMSRKQKKEVEMVYNSSQSQGSQIGRQQIKMDYISLRKAKNKSQPPLQHNNLCSQLFRNQEICSYLSALTQSSSPKQLKTFLLNSILSHLRNRRNVCLYGGMDKIQFLEEVEQLLQDHDEYLFVVRGHAQPLTEKKVYNQFGTFLMQCGFKKIIHSVLLKEQEEQYRQILEQTSPETIIYVVFYDISNYAYLSVDIQTKLANLLTLPRIRLITTIENIKILLNTSFKNLQKYNFAFINMKGLNTPYNVLIKMLPLQSQRSQKTQMQIIQIWKSLNRNQRQIAMILAQNQLQNMAKSEQNYLSFSELLQCCVQKIILNDDHQLRENLIQLTDHKVIIQEIDKIKNKKVFIMKLERRILESMVQGKYDVYDTDNAHY